MSNEKVNKEELLDEIANTGTVLLFLDTHEISENEDVNVRPWSNTQPTTEDDIERIKSLAATIDEEGQLQPVVVGPRNGNGLWPLIAGHRRKKAIELINAGRAKGQELRVKAIVSVNADEAASAFRQAAIENVHRKDLNAMDMAANIQNVRSKFKWIGPKNTQKVAEFFKVSKASVVQYEKLLQLPKDIQAKVYASEITRDDAFKLAVLGNEQAKAVLNIAQEIEQDVEKIGGTRKQAKAAKTKVIKKAAREVKAKKREAAGKPPSLIARTRTEIIEFYESLRGPAYGHANGAVLMFLDKFGLWVKGGLSDSTLIRWFDVMVEKADRGTPEREKVVTAAKGKTVTKPKK